MILLGLRAQPHLDSVFSPHPHLKLRSTSPTFPTKEAEELDEAEYYKRLQKARDSYTYPQTVHQRQDKGEASAALQKAKFILAKTDENPSERGLYRGTYRIKLGGTSSYILEGGNFVL